MSNHTILSLLEQGAEAKEVELAAGLCPTHSQEHWTGGLGCSLQACSGRRLSAVEQFLTNVICCRWAPFEAQHALGPHTTDTSAASLTAAAPAA
jgi:hypothetical protein